MTEAQQVAWVITFLRGDAAVWWAGIRTNRTIDTFEKLKTELTTRFVGPNAFELLCADLEGRTLVSFTKFEAFRAWFVEVVSAMRSFAPAGRMWGENVLIDRLTLCLRGTLYHEGVVLDPVARERPTTLEHALRLLDERHRVLLMRGQAYGKEGKAAGDKPKPSPPGKPKSTNGPAAPKGQEKKRDRQSKGRLPFDEHIAQMHGLDLALVRARLKDPTGVCAVCGQTGHKVASCPAHRRVREESKAKRARQEN